MQLVSKLNCFLLLIIADKNVSQSYLNWKIKIINNYFICNQSTYFTNSITCCTVYLYLIVLIWNMDKLNTNVYKTGKGEASGTDQEKQLTGLCCCEYIGKENKRFHLLACCCDCEEFDSVFTRAVTCHPIDPEKIASMLLTFQDRFRIPWRGGAKQVSLDVVVPFVILPILIGIAAINGYTATIIFVTGSIFISYIYVHVKRNLSRTRFFCLWIVWSVIYMLALFEFTVPLFELLPEENIILKMLIGCSLFCFYRTKQRAPMNIVMGSKSSVHNNELPNILQDTADCEDESVLQTALLLEQDYNDKNEIDEEAMNHSANICPTCRKYITPKTGHCSVCSACIMRLDHHSYWLDCCIGMSNHLYYLLGLFLSELALLLGANLTLTAVCHPFLVVRLLGVPIMLPDDCTEVFDEYELGISFIIAVYALIIAAYIFIVLLLQIYQISRGRNGNENNCINNWKAFIF